MGRFLEAEKSRQTLFKSTPSYFSKEAQMAGMYRGKLRPFCLPASHSEENLFNEIRASAIAYFSKYAIKWHDAQKGGPSNHLCDSHVCCVNFLFPFADKPDALKELLRPVFPDIRQTVPMEDPGQFVSCEWIGLKNYLGEKVPKHGKRTRGANFTSADAAVMFERNDGSRQIALIEWKYTESYSSTFLRFAKSGTDRAGIYRHLFERDHFPLDKTLLPSFDALFYEPFYQLFRQQALANEMENAHELGADAVSVIHIAPAHNTDFQKITSPPLLPLGDTVIDVWKQLVRTSNRFTSVSTEELFGGFPVERYPELAAWWDYVTARYSWVEA